LKDEIHRHVKKKGEARRKAQYAKVAVCSDTGGPDVVYVSNEYIKYTKKCAAIRSIVVFHSSGQGHPTTVFCKISVRRSKFCLEFSFFSKVLWAALKVFSMHLGGNRRWVPLSFETNNNKKRYRAHKFYFNISSAVSSLQLHSRGQIFPLS